MSQLALPAADTPYTLGRTVSNGRAEEAPALVSAPRRDFLNTYADRLENGRTAGVSAADFSAPLGETPREWRQGRTGGLCYHLGLTGENLATMPVRLFVGNLPYEATEA